MKTKQLLVLLLVWSGNSLGCSRAQGYYPFQDPQHTVVERAENLVSLLTLDEKIDQMMNDAPAVERLGIPAYNWWSECLHGVARSPYRVTSFPQAIGMAATWDTQSLLQMARYTADEARAIYNDASSKGRTGIYQGLTYWSPNVNIFRDPRWGRGQETYGEDPYLTSQLGMAFVRGLQGDDSRYLKVSACAKHYAVHSGPEWNRSSFNAVVSDQDLWDTYLPAFEKLVVDAKVSGVMCAYNAYLRQPCCGNDVLLTNILRKQWGFSGYVTSDCGGINHFFRTHKTHPDKQSAAADAVLHGTDCECSNDGAYKALHEAVDAGLLTERDIDVSLKRLFEIRLRLGMFDPPGLVPYSRISTDVLECEAHGEHALKMARQSIVLLKNEGGLLPLDKKKIRKIAVVGPNAANESVMLGNYFGIPSEIYSVLEGVRQALSDSEAEVIYEPGCGYVDNRVFHSEWDASCFSFDGQPGWQAEYFANPALEGKPVEVRRESAICFQHGDGEEVVPGVSAHQMSIRYKAGFIPARSGEVTFYLSGDDGYRLYIDGRLRLDSRQNECYYTLDAEAGRTYDVVIEYWQYSDICELTLDMGHLQLSDARQVARRAKDADVILYVGGLSASLEGESMNVPYEGFKGGDRLDIALPRVQTDLMKALYATGKPVIFVLLTGSAVGLEWEAGHIPAILNAWYPGQAGGKAVADVLFGDYNPAGRLPVTFYKRTEDLPDFEDYSMDNRTYRYFRGEPRYPFGYGLSFTSFTYDNLEVKLVDGGYQVCVEVTNTGQRDGEEVVQLYVSGSNQSFRVPIRSLKGFTRIFLKAGQTRRVTLPLPDAELTWVNEAGKRVKMTGPVQVTVGGGQPLPGISYRQTVIERPEK